MPHSIQAHEQGCEFLLVADDVDFSDVSVNQWLALTPPELVDMKYRLIARRLTNALPHVRIPAGR
jgi:oxalate decarboxylase